MKKKLLLIVSMCLCILGMTACTKTDPTTAVYNGYSYDELQSSAQNTIVALASMSDEDKTNYLSNDNEIVVNLINRWDEASQGIGDYVGCNADDFSITKSDDTLTTKQIVQFDNEPITVSFVYTYSTMELKDITVDQVANTENMSLNIWICIGIAAIALAVIILVFFGIRQAVHSKDIQEPSALSAGVDDNQIVNQITQREQADLELTAVIAAAIAAATGTPIDGFVVRSIKRR